MVSVDTTRAAVAADALEAGASVVNDVSGGLADPAMLGVVADAGVVYVAMHWRGPSDVMDALADYDDVVADVRDELAARLGRGGRRPASGPSRWCSTPGWGSPSPARTTGRCWPTWTPCARWADRCWSVRRARGSSGTCSRVPDGPAPPEARDEATVAVTALAAAAGAWCVRVHEVAGSADAVRVAAAWTAARTGGEGG